MTRHANPPLLLTSVALPTVPVEAALFRRLHWWLVRSALTQVRDSARLRAALVVLLSSTFWASLFWIFRDAFSFLRNEIGHAATHEMTVRTMFNVYYSALMVMLLFSASIICYGMLYRTREVEFLLTTPARTERIVLHKFYESFVFSSWGFLLVGTPMLMAHGYVVGAPWYYYAMAVPFLAAFVYIPVAIGTIFCILVVRFLPTSKVSVLVVAFIFVCLPLAWIGLAMIGSSGSDMFTPHWFQDVVGRLEFAQHRLLPSWWLSSGLLEAGRSSGAEWKTPGRTSWSESIMFLALLFSNALVVHLLLVGVARRWFRASYVNLVAAPGVRRGGRFSALDWFVEHAAFMFSRPLRLMLVKDFRTFRRDPVQWSQFVVFFGLLALYFANLRRFGYNFHHVAWAHMISFLNIVVVGLILSAFTTRFIFPSLSLEGQRFWILSILPVRRYTILWAKFVFAVVGTTLACCPLIFISDRMLRVTSTTIVGHQIACLLLCMGLAGIAVGLGARMPNMSESSPARIAAGFGGTLNLVLSTMYIIVLLAVGVVPLHIHQLAASTTTHTGVAAHLQRGIWATLGSSWTVAASAATASLLAGIAVGIPMYLGNRHFRKLEM
jgi:ABC-2 type transport system permease protein